MQNVKVRQGLNELRRDTSVLMNVASIAVAVEALEALLIEKKLIAAGDLEARIKEMATNKMLGPEAIKEKPVILGLDQL